LYLSVFKALLFPACVENVHVEPAFYGLPDKRTQGIGRDGFELGGRLQAALYELLCVVAGGWLQVGLNTQPAYLLGRQRRAPQVYKVLRRVGD
jgi:hypothetical protein